jgi:hypothetical protein
MRFLEIAGHWKNRYSEIPEKLKRFFEIIRGNETGFHKWTLIHIGVKIFGS